LYLRPENIRKDSVSSFSIFFGNFIIFLFSIHILFFISISSRFRTMSSTKRSCSPSTSQSKRGRLTGQLYLTNRIDRSGSFREYPCHFCSCHSLSCWVADFSNRCSQCIRADRLCENAFPMSPSRGTTAFLVASRCVAAIALSRNFSKLSRALQADLSDSTSSASPVPSPLAASSPAYSSVSVASVDPVGMVSPNSRYRSF